MIGALCGESVVPPRRPRRRPLRGGVPAAPGLHPRAVRPLLRRGPALVAALAPRGTPVAPGPPLLRGLLPVPALRPSAGGGARAHGQPPHEQRDLLLPRAAPAPGLRGARAQEPQGAEGADG